MSIAEELSGGCSKLNIALNQETQQQLLKYVTLLKKWNSVYNLTAIREEHAMVSHHLLDSLAVLPYLWTGRWLDVGCGAGLPGIVLAIAKPDWRVTLIDSNSKKTSFVQQVIIELGITNADVHNARAEDWHSETLFDGIISRAFSELAQFINVTRHLISPAGKWAAMKGKLEQCELGQLPGDCKVTDFINLEVPGIRAERSLVIASCKGIT